MLGLEVLMTRAVILILAAALLSAVLVGACRTGGQATGTLEGTVTIGPISPVQREGVKEEIPPEVYAARKVMVYDSGGKKLVQQVDLEDDGTYRVELKVGTYTVDINRIGVDSSDEVPRQVDIVAGETVLLDIDIDTGIR
jgi:hypothetical protein